MKNKRSHNRQVTKSAGNPLAKHSTNNSKVILQQQMTAQSFSGPLPHPNVLRLYDELLPGLANRIVTQAEKQTAHRIELENKVIASDIINSRLGIASAFIISMVAILGGGYLIYLGHEWPGSIFSVGSLGSLVTVFIYGTNSRKKERIEKNNR